MKIHAEVFFNKIIGDKIYYFKKRVDVSEEEDSPDVFVRKLVVDLAVELKANLDKTIVHSTSWRCAHCGQIALTYIVYSDFFDFGGNKVESLEINDLKIKSSGKKDKPTPHKITDRDIVSHGIRHISFLVKNDPNQYKGALIGEDISKFRKIDDVLAGSITKRGGDLA